MFGLFEMITGKKLKKQVNEIGEELTELSGQNSNNKVLIESNKNNISANSKEIAELKLLVAELKGVISVREQVRESPRTSRTPQAPKTKFHKKANKIADKVQILAEIKELIDKNLNTSEIYDVIVLDKGLCAKTCFYKYLKLVREQSLRTPRTITAN